MARKNSSVSLTTLLPSLNMWMLWVLGGINSIPLPGWDLIYLRLINMTWSFLQQWLIRVTLPSPWPSNVIPQLVCHLWVLFCSYWKRLTLYSLFLRGNMKILLFLEAFYDHENSQYEDRNKKWRERDLTKSQKSEAGPLMEHAWSLTYFWHWFINRWIPIFV